MIEEIRQLATGVREAIEISKSAWPQTWTSDFPHGACGDTCLVLGAILADAGHADFEHIGGELEKADGRYSTHAWLQKNNLIVDITADQFPDFDLPVFVMTDSTWHRRWRVSQRSPGDLKAYPVAQVAELYDLYNVVSKKMKFTR